MLLHNMGRKPILHLKETDLNSRLLSICLSFSLPFFLFLSLSFFFSSSIFFFLGPHLWHMEVPRLNRSYSYKPTPQPQQQKIWPFCRFRSVTYTTAHSNARSLTHWAGSGIQPSSSWILIGFIIAEPQQELLELLFSWTLDFYSAVHSFSGMRTVVLTSIDVLSKR